MQQDFNLLQIDLISDSLPICPRHMKLLSVNRLFVLAKVADNISTIVFENVIERTLVADKMGENDSDQMNVT